LFSLPEVNFSKRSIVKRTGGTEGTGNVSFLATITADKSRDFLQRSNLIGLAGLGKFADMQFVIFRIGAQIADIDEFSTHGDDPLLEP
jgi:hypothetical protein